MWSSVIVLVNTMQTNLMTYSLIPKSTFYRERLIERGRLFEQIRYSGTLWQLESAATQTYLHGDEAGFFFQINCAVREIYR